MSIGSPSQDLYGFAVELRKLAYTMPGGQRKRFYPDRLEPTIAEWTALYA
jgi:hypothetical protein